MRSRNILLTLPEEWIIKLTERARHLYISRNGLVRLYLRDALSRAHRLVILQKDDDLSTRHHKNNDIDSLP